ncbi:MAG: DUF1971 domain-containing protein [Halioglobus sp.]
MLELPKAVKPYKKTPAFTKDTIPRGLLAEHSTKAGTWGVLEVEEAHAAIIRRQSSKELPRSIVPPSTTFA